MHLSRFQAKFQRMMPITSRFYERGMFNFIKTVKILSPYLPLLEIVAWVHQGCAGKKFWTLSYVWLKYMYECITQHLFFTTKASPSYLITLKCAQHTGCGQLAQKLKWVLKIFLYFKSIQHSKFKKQGNHIFHNSPLSYCHTSCGRLWPFEQGSWPCQWMEKQSDIVASLWWQ